MTCLKLMEMRLNDKMDTALKNQDHMQATADTLTAITTHIDSDFSGLARDFSLTGARGRRESLPCQNDGASLQQDPLGVAHGAVPASGTHSTEAGGEMGGGEGGDRANLERAFTAILQSIDGKLETIAKSLSPGRDECQAVAPKGDTGASDDERASPETMHRIKDGFPGGEQHEHAAPNRWRSKIRRKSVDPLFEMTSTNVLSGAGDEGQQVLNKLRPPPAQETGAECLEVQGNEGEIEGEPASLVLGDGVILETSPLIARRRERAWKNRLKHTADDAAEDGQAGGPSGPIANEEASKHKQMREEQHLEELTRQLLHSPRQSDVEIERGQEPEESQESEHEDGEGDVQGRKHDEEEASGRFRKAELAVIAAGRLTAPTQGESIGWLACVCPAWQSMLRQASCAKTRDSQVGGSIAQRRRRDTRRQDRYRREPGHDRGPARVAWRSRPG